MSLNLKASKYLTGVAFGACMLMTAGVAQASHVSCAEPNFLNLTVNTAYCGNEPFTTITVDGTTTPSLVKWDGGPIEEGIAPGNYADDISVTVNAGGTSGTWTFLHDVGELFPHYVVYKASGAFFIQLVTDLTDVAWSTLALLGTHEISHISFFDTTVRPPGEVGPVPVPAALPLLLSALGGLTWLSRRRRSNRAA